MYTCVLESELEGSYGRMLSDGSVRRRQVPLQTLPDTLHVVGLQVVSE